MQQFSLVIHGGAGTILRSEMSAEMEVCYMDALSTALDAGWKVLQNEGSSTDAVRTAIVSLENNELFNAGKGSVFGKNGSQEMDASIMSGKDLDAGAVSAVKNIKNPIELAFAVMKQTPHVMLNGVGANEFADSIDAVKEEDEYFYSAFRYEQWKLAQKENRILLDHQPGDHKKFGTVGAAACDQHGNIAAGTSTGGMTNKQWGRVGDSSIIGAGTYANNKTCAISCTGHGELFIRSVAAYDVSCLMEYKGMSLQEAMNVVVNEKLVAINGEGGMIGVDAQGNTSLQFNSEGMYRGMQTSSGQRELAIYK